MSRYIIKLVQLFLVFFIDSLSLYKHKYQLSLIILIIFYWIMLRSKLPYTKDKQSVGVQTERSSLVHKVWPSNSYMFLSYSDVDCSIRLFVVSSTKHIYDRSEINIIHSTIRVHVGLCICAWHKWMCKVVHWRSLATILTINQ